MPNNMEMDQLQKTTEKEYYGCDLDSENLPKIQSDCSGKSYHAQESFYRTKRLESYNQQEKVSGVNPRIETPLEITKENGGDPQVSFKHSSPISAYRCSRYRRTENNTHAQNGEPLSRKDEEETKMNLLYSGNPFLDSTNSLSANPVTDIGEFQVWSISHPQNGFDWYVVQPNQLLQENQHEPLVPQDNLVMENSNQPEEEPNRMVSENEPQISCLHFVAPERTAQDEQAGGSELVTLRVDSLKDEDVTRCQASPTPSDEKSCRICQDGESKEPLVSPCRCTGTVGYIHVSCLNTWLQVTTRTSCELCGFDLPVTRHPASLSEYLRNPRENMDLPNLLCDLSCLLVLTPLLFSSVYLSSTGAFQYQTLGNTGSVSAIVTLLIALMLVYISWMCLAVLYHVRIFQAWRERNGTVSRLDEQLIANNKISRAHIDKWSSDGKSTQKTNKFRFQRRPSTDPSCSPKRLFSKRVSPEASPAGEVTITETVETECSSESTCSDLHTVADTTTLLVNAKQVSKNGHDVNTK